MKANRILSAIIALYAGSSAINEVIRNCPTAKEERERSTELICFAFALFLVFATAYLSSIPPPEMCNRTDATMFSYIIAGEC